MNNEPDQTEDELTELRCELRGELISCMQMWFQAMHRNESCGESIDFVQALDKYIDFRIQQALK
jgi:hypothetical protein